MGIEVALSVKPIRTLGRSSRLIRGGKQGLNRICNLGAKTRPDLVFFFLFLVFLSFPCCGAVRV
jgi:hypothetical protein